MRPIVLSLGLLAACNTAETVDSNLGEASDQAALLTVGAEDEVCDGICDPITIDHDKSLIVTDPEILERFRLRKVLDKLASDVGSSAGPDDIWRQWWSSQRLRTGADPAHHPFCDDNGGTINGFPIECPRAESDLEHDLLDAHTPVALVNRFDLAPMDGAHCGEYRIVYAKDGQTVPAEPSQFGGRNFLIFEGVLPNPNPECELAGCLPVAEFWQNLTTEPDVGTRADLLERFYFEGVCGFEEVVRPEHYGLECRGEEGYGGACGQIRTNQFMQGPWNLREYQLGFDNGELLVNQVTVKANPHVDLFTGADPSFNADYSSNISTLLPNPDGINFLFLSTDPSFDAGESPADPSGPFPENRYLTSAGSGLEVDTQNELNALYGTPPITVAELDERATTQSCGGCHQISNGAGLGTSVSGGSPLTWPGSLGFVHIDEFSNLSPALTDPGMFLDHREQVLFDYLDVACGNDCFGEATGSFLIKPVDNQSDPEDGTPLVTFELVTLDEFVALEREGLIPEFDTLSGHKTH